MMCGCDEEFGITCLPHQITQSQSHGMTARIPITLGIVANVCNTCRGLPEEPHPAAESYGRSSKVSRFYWRELRKESLAMFDSWVKSNGFSGWMEAAAQYEDTRKKIEREVLEELKVAHERAPKYAFKEDSQEEVIRRHGVEVTALSGVHIATPDGMRILDRAEECTPEDFAERHFQRQGYRTLFVESVPLHVLFGTFMWMLIEDVNDPDAGPPGFGDRHNFDRGEGCQMMWMTLPDDFGTAEYVQRRAAAVAEHLKLVQSILDDGALGWLFDLWLEPSVRLRQYLWAHRQEDIDRARNLLEALPQQTTWSILTFLLGGCWERYLGWPDLLCYTENEFFFVEVKSSRDKLSQQQKEWIRLNAEHLKLPFRLLKIHNRDPKQSGHDK
jgi:hypothetical protein